MVLKVCTLDLWSFGLSYNNIIKFNLRSCISCRCVMVHCQIVLALLCDLLVVITAGTLFICHVVS